MIWGMDKGRIIGMKESGQSTRAVARATEYDRNTVSRIWNEYQRLVAALEEPADTREAEGGRVRDQRDHD